MMIPPKMTRRSVLGALGIGTLTATAAACSSGAGGVGGAGGDGEGGLFVVGTIIGLR